MEWRAELQANQPLAEEFPARPPSLAVEPQVVPPPPLEALPKQVIEGDQEPVVKATESDGSIEQIDNLDGVLERMKSIDSRSLLAKVLASGGDHRSLV